MSLTRKFLTALGIEPEKIEEIITAHSETVTALKEQVETYKADAEKLPGIQKELDTLRAETQDGNAYDKLKAEYDEYKAGVQKKETLAAKRTALSEVAKDAGLTEAGIAKALKYADYESLELDEKGKLTNPQDMIKALREEWSEHVQSQQTQGAQTATPPAGASSKTYKTKDEIMAIKDAGERQLAIAQNHEMFGF